MADKSQSFAGGIRKTLENFSLAVRSIGVRVHERPILLLGNQKSGTTAIAALLAEMAGLPITLDLKKEFTDPVIDQLRTNGMTMKDFVERHRLDFSRPMIKEPSLTPFYRELASFFPESTFVIVVRDPRDNIRSILNRLNIPGNLDAIPVEARPQITRAWQLILNGEWLGLPGEHYIDKLAHRWNFTTDIYLANADEIILSRFEDFIADKPGEIKRLANRLGLAARNDISGKVNVQFQPAGDHKVTWQEFFGGNLQRIESICAERMEAMGYGNTSK